MGHILLDFWPLGLTNSTNFTTVAAKLGRLLSFFEARSNVLKGEENTEKQARIQEKYQSQEVGCTKVGDNDFFLQPVADDEVPADVASEFIFGKPWPISGLVG